MKSILRILIVNALLPLIPEGRGQRHIFDESVNKSVQNLLNAHNIVNYELDGSGWVIETLIPPAASLQNIDFGEGLMSFVFIEYGASQHPAAYALWPETAGLQEGATNPNLDVDNAGSANFARLAPNTNPTRADQSVATTFIRIGADDGAQVQ